MLSKLLAVTALCQATASPVALSDIQVQTIDRFHRRHASSSSLPGDRAGKHESIQRRIQRQGEPANLARAAPIRFRIMYIM